MNLSAPDPALDPWFARELLRLQHAAYRAEAALVGDDRIPPLQDDDVTLPAWRGRYLVAWRGVELLGAIAWRDDGDHLDIDRLMVDPRAHRQRVGTTLLEAVLGRADGRPVVVSTGRDNTPARALYSRHGFEVGGDEQVPPGIWITHLRRA
ncbi:MAG: GNAT family N-acetyltransferase [Actinomycetes bacterium]